MPLPDTFDAYVPSNLTELFARATIPTFVSLKKLREFEGDVANRFEPSYKYAKKLYSQTILDHCLRCYYLSLAILRNFPSNTPSIPQISRDELIQRVYLTCILHDVGLSLHETVTIHPAHDMTFEFHGGIMVYEHLRADYVAGLRPNDSQIADITQSIMLHTIPFQTGMSSATGMLMYVSALFDILGYDAAAPNLIERAVHRDTVREINETFARDNMTLFSDSQVQEMLKVKPNCLVGHSPHLVK
ncbi:hypothetical protein J3R30DRAFT_683929 [Lentinula aciculospora]|uniref:HD domain-containing protein n=1 Tax=Lentinula aciculospora TaxID=153920 RepID=A0A9W9A651_9AGAR|nr:hypothetical protein J3R30DRAFT_683929 [Lentinula aciculospora]